MTSLLASELTHGLVIRGPAETVGSRNAIKDLDLLSIGIISPELSPLLAILLVWQSHTSVEHSTVGISIPIVESGNVVVLLWKGL